MAIKKSKNMSKSVCTSDISLITHVLEEFTSYYNMDCKIPVDIHHRLGDGCYIPQALIQTAGTRKYTQLYRSLLGPEDIYDAIGDEFKQWVRNNGPHGLYSFTTEKEFVNHLPNNILYNKYYKELRLRSNIKELFKPFQANSILASVLMGICRLSPSDYIMLMDRWGFLIPNGKNSGFAYINEARMVLDNLLRTLVYNAFFSLLPNINIRSIENFRTRELRLEVHYGLNSMTFSFYMNQDNFGTMLGNMLLQIFEKLYTENTFCADWKIVIIDTANRNKVYKRGFYVHGSDSIYQTMKSIISCYTSLIKEIH